MLNLWKWKPWEASTLFWHFNPWFFNYKNWLDQFPDSFLYAAVFKITVIIVLISSLNTMRNSSRLKIMCSGIMFRFFDSSKQSGIDRPTSIDHRFGWKGVRLDWFCLLSFAGQVLRSLSFCVFPRVHPVLATIYRFFRIMLTNGFWVKNMVSSKDERNFKFLAQFFQRILQLYILYNTQDTIALLQEKDHFKRKLALTL